MTDDLLALADWLAAEGVTHVGAALQLTGGRFQLLLVYAREVKQVPGCKTDVKDCEWIADLLRHGLLKARAVSDSLPFVCATIPPASSRTPRSFAWPACSKACGVDTERTRRRTRIPSMARAQLTRETRNDLLPDGQSEPRSHQSVTSVCGARPA
jgi:hypothetical protein